MSSIIFLTHPEVVIDQHQPITEWPLSRLGRARMDTFVDLLKGRPVTALYASTERKAMDGAGIVGQALGLSVKTRADLGENGRESTGYIAPPEFWDVVAEFFTHPTRSIRGWERAIDAQARIVGAVRAVEADEPDGDIVVVSHGGVGCLLTAHLQDVPIGQETRPSHPGGGCFLTLGRDPLSIRADWRAIEDGFAGAPSPRTATQ